MSLSNLDSYVAPLVRIIAAQIAALATGFWLFSPHKEPNVSSRFGNPNLAFKAGAVFALNVAVLAASVGYEVGSSQSACPK